MGDKVRIEWTFGDLFMMAFYGIPAFAIAGFLWGLIFSMIGFVIMMVLMLFGIGLGALGSLG